MKELFYAAFSAVNLIPSALLIFILVYWIIVLFGFLDFHFLHFDVHSDAHVDADPHIHAEFHPHVHADIHADVHADAHIDAHAHVDSDVGTHDHGGHHTDSHAHVGNTGADWLSYTFRFLNIGRVPFMIYLSFLILPLWIISTLLNNLINNQSFLLSLLLLIPNLFASLIVAKVCTTPLANMFHKLDMETKQDETFIGNEATVILPIDHAKFGQIEVTRKSAHIIFNAYCIKGLEITKGEKVMIIDFDHERKCYIVEPYKI